MFLLRLTTALSITIASLIAGPAAEAVEVISPGPSVATDCSADVTTAFNRLFDSVPDGATVQLAPGGCYRIDREVRVGGKDRLTLDGRGATLRRFTPSPPDLHYPRANAMIRFGDLTNSTITGLRIRGINTRSDVPGRPEFGAWGVRHAFDHGVVLAGAQNVTLKNTTIHAVFGDGVSIGGSDTYPQAKGVVVRDTHIQRNGRQGIAITSADGVLIDGVTIAHSRRAGVDLEPHRDKVVSDVEIRNSKFTTRLLAVSGGGVGVVNNVFIHHNTFLASALPLVHDHSSEKHDPRENWRVIENDVAFTIRSSAPAMSFKNTKDVLVHGNRISFALGSGLAVALYRSTAVVACNRFTGAIDDFVKTDTESVVRRERNSLGSGTPECPTPALRTGVTMTPAEPSTSPKSRQVQPPEPKKPAPETTPSWERPDQKRVLAKPAESVTPSKQTAGQDDSQRALAAAERDDWTGAAPTRLAIVIAAIALTAMVGRRLSRRRLSGRRL